MAKRRKALPARPPVDGAGEEHSLLLRSAESLGRVIGALQRQLDDASKRLSLDGNGSARPLVSMPAMNRPARTPKKTKTAAARNGAKKKAVARKTTSTKRKRAVTRH
jgi:hypothetical protein